MAATIRAKRKPTPFPGSPIYPAPDSGQGRSFLHLRDTPRFYGQPGQVPIVNAAGTGFDWSNASGLPDAPQDGSIYGRQDGAWVVVGSTGVGEAPQDGTPYARQDGGWVSFDPFIDAPSDSLYYARRNGAWVSFNPLSDAPQDGTIYGRRDGIWVAVPDPGIGDAPSDNGIYARQNGSWIAFSPFPEAPQNGEYYARRNGTWITFEPFPEAPSNGTYYARRNGAWSGFTPIGEAPQDGTPYARQDGGWVSVPDPGIADAPSDGTLYGRQDGAWVAVPPDTDEWLDDKLAAGNVTINRRSRTYTLQLSSYATEVYDGSNTLVADIRLDPLGEAVVFADSALLLESQGVFFMRSTLGVEFQTGLGSLLYRMPISSPSTGQVLTAGATATQLEWTTPASGIGDAPSDGTKYVRQNGAWAADPLQTDAPSSGNLYARQNGAWVVVPPDEWLDDKLAAGDVTISHTTRDLNFELDRFTVGTFFSTTQNTEFSLDPFGQIRLNGSGQVRIESTGTSVFLEYATSLIVQKSGVTQWVFPLTPPAAGQIMAANPASPTDLIWIDPPSGGGLTDAPSDGTLYGRQDGSWVAVPPNTDEWLDDKLAAGSVNINRTNRQLTLSLSRFLTSSVLGGQIDVSDSVNISTSGSDIIEAKAGGSIALETGLGANIIVREGSSIRYILPNDQPSTGQVLTAGATPQFLEWATPSGGSGTWLKPELEAGNAVTITNAAATLRFDINRIDLYSSGIGQVKANSYFVDTSQFRVRSQSGTTWFTFPKAAPTQMGEVMMSGSTPTDLSWGLPPMTPAGFTKSQVLLSRFRYKSGAPFNGEFNANTTSGTWASYDKLHFDKRTNSSDAGWNGGIDWDAIPADVLIQILDNQTGRVYLYRATAITADVSTSKRWAVTYLNFQGSTSGAPIENTFCIVTFYYD